MANVLSISGCGLFVFCKLRERDMHILFEISVRDKDKTTDTASFIISLFPTLSPENSVIIRSKSNSKKYSVFIKKRDFGLDFFLISHLKIRKKVQYKLIFFLDTPKVIQAYVMALFHDTSY